MFYLKSRITDASDPVADPGFPRGGGANHKGGAPTYYFAEISKGIPLDLPMYNQEMHVS